MKDHFFSNQKGQLLLEIIVAVGLLAVAGALVSQLTLASLRLNKASSEINVADALLRETAEAVNAISFSRWQNIYNLTKDNEHYYATTSSGVWIAAVGDETVSMNGLNYTRFFVVTDVCRDSAGQIIATATAPCIGLVNDPSTQRITITVGSPTATSTASHYVTRWRNRTCILTAWTATTTGTSSCPTTFFESISNLIATSSGSSSLELYSL